MVESCYRKRTASPGSDSWSRVTYGEFYALWPCVFLCRRSRQGDSVVTKRSGISDGVRPGPGAYGPDVFPFQERDLVQFVYGGVGEMRTLEPEFMEEAREFFT